MRIEKICILSNGTLKEEYDIPTVTEGIEEPKMLVRCENCIHKDRVSDYCMYLKRKVKREEFCCWGTHK